MARLFMDSCGDHYDISHITNKWDVVGNCGILTNEPGATGNCLHISPQAFSYFDTICRRNLTVAQSRLIAGFRFKCQILPSGYQSIAGFWIGGTCQCIVYVDASGRVSVSRDYYAGGLTPVNMVGAYSLGGLIRPDVWVYIEVDITFDADPVSSPGTGAMTLRVNSQTVATASGIRAANVVGGANQFSLHSGVSAQWLGATFDDVYLNNNIGSVNNGFDGDQQILCLFPSAPGASTQWTIGGSSPAITNWQSVNQAISDDDVTYVSTDVSGLVDLYKVPTLSTNIVSITATQMILNVKTDSSGLGTGASVAPVIGDGGAHPINVGTPVYINTGYSDVLQCYGLNPLTNAAWNINDFNHPAIANRLQIGIKRIT